MIWPKMTVDADCQNLTSVRTDPSGRIITIKNRTVCVGSMFSDQFGSHSHTPLLVNQSASSRLGPWPDLSSTMMNVDLDVIMLTLPLLTFGLPILMIAGSIIAYLVLPKRLPTHSGSGSSPQKCLVKCPGPLAFFKLFFKLFTSLFKSCVSAMIAPFVFLFRILRFIDRLTYAIGLLLGGVLFVLATVIANRLCFLGFNTMDVFVRIWCFCTGAADDFVVDAFMMDADDAGDWDARKYPKSRPFWGKRGVAFEQFVRDFSAAMAAEGDDDASLEDTMLGVDPGGDDPSAPAGAGAAQVRRRNKRLRELYAHLYRHVTAPPRNDAR